MLPLCKKRSIDNCYKHLLVFVFRLSCIFSRLSCIFSKGYFQSIEVVVVRFDFIANH